MNDIEIQKNYENARDTPSDINFHLPILLEYSNKCEHVTEMGVRGVVSLWAFLASSAKKVVAIDILDVWVPDVPKLKFICANDLEIEIEETDFLFIDTAHNYNQCIQELNLHGWKVLKYIAFHDTFIFGENGDDRGKGLNYAIREYLEKTPVWKVVYHTDVNNGLTVIQRGE